MRSKGKEVKRRINGRVMEIKKGEGRKGRERKGSEGEDVRETMR